MGIGDKLMFWKKNDSLDFNSDMGGFDSSPSGSMGDSGLGSMPDMGGLGGGLGSSSMGNPAADPLQSLGASPQSPAHPGMAAPHNDPLGAPSQDPGLSDPMHMGASQAPAMPQNPHPQLHPDDPSHDTFGPPQPAQQHHATHTGSSDYMVSKDIEVISSKLDALKAAIDSMNQRLINIEDMARSNDHGRRKNVW
ncbi:hypothetical protein HN419_03345 [Candidatus Woesearchaeota archaeon]|jgi:hypothetical protein|nr:hypothetical protein [Candidatus Woesearchaeota archaeon]MBT3536968.1 hypothetical protein [Candidatus Woesearchaeota archaeon]MBT4697578.1 hypothetical protein [Candidatus Woesearchaeota archaeon]MBT4717692.1 hypothetical protein [Candidatus Woesearchaeota archaeon]MBT7106722.1 hypothetical protein [Candidatus Woesearchaeota archaeon]